MHHATTLIIVIQAWVMIVHKRAVRRAAFPPITYGPMLERDQERISNLNYIYNCNDVEDEKNPFLGTCENVQGERSARR